ncbi:GNAT family N-acetyltransferase [Mycetocola zhujimingii]|uniref:N-acetyltransferase n=1 Tax=Mycetocola zhujimingii TaxID=2079792 RepID=A0A2U1TED8_9MICO|nr:GNAT family protein [Mycetocola zhujimingii]AWB86088.1 N-acetyltransferase [Mycetocola zhujimingii]PWC07180.1 N-acetyltransferase [Mycetocola zhujimingii]
MPTSPWPARSGALLLRDMRPDDLPQLVALRNNPSVNHFMLRTHVDPEAWCREWLAIPDSETDFSCVAQLDGEIAGLGFLDVIDGMGQPGMPERTQGVMGYMLELDLAGRGLGTDLARGLLSAAFDSLELRRVMASCNADNVASARVLEKVGMRREQHGVQDSWHAELGWVDGYQYALLDHEWRDMHP